VASLQLRTFLINDEISFSDKLYNAIFSLLRTILNSNGSDFLDALTFTAQGIFSTILFTSFAILSNTLKSSHATLISKSAQPQGHEDASTIFTFAFFITLTSFLIFSTISLDVCFLFSFKLTVILAQWLQSVHIEVEKFLISLFFISISSTSFTMFEVFSNSLPASASMFIVKLFLSHFSKNSIFKIHNAGKAIEDINNNTIINKNILTLFVFATNQEIISQYFFSI
jgi:hypothetical protein